MFKAIARKLFGSANERELRKLWPYIIRANELESRYAAMTDDEIRSEIVNLRQTLDNALSPLKDIKEKNEKQEELLMQIMPDSFAMTREAAKRTLGQRHFDVQLLGGLVLHKGVIAEMRTGEGKTLTSTSPLVLNALTGRGSHLVTVNEYLAKRDSEWMGRIYKFLGLSVGIIYHGQSQAEKKAAYGSDICYGTNNEYGFDYLRDNMKYSFARMVQRELHFAIIDEVDSILIDEARTPLIISGPSEEDPHKYVEVNNAIRKIVEKNKPRLPQYEKIIKQMETEIGRPLSEKEKKAEAEKILLFSVDEKDRAVELTENGVTEVERLLGVDNLYDPKNIVILHLVHQSLMAHNLYVLDREYVLMEEEGIKKVVIVDEFTGRTMPGRRWSDGLHQSIEAKEGVPIESENQTLATITLQNFFRMYKKIAGMTGTADTEAVEFKQIYNLGVNVIPTNKPMIRKDFQDVIYKTEPAKWIAIADKLEELHKRGQPALVGTISVEKSEYLSKMLEKRRVPHQVLNAKFHEKEAGIIAQAGRKGMVTIATNMAGRGTDIILGGNVDFMAWEKLAYNFDAPLEEFKRVREKLIPEWEKERAEVIEAGGLFVLGTERHESRRIDNQLRGRSGRQGEPGASRFFISLEDDIARLFAGQRLKNLMDRFNMPDDVPIEHRIISNTIEKAQKTVEARNFDIRKNLLEYDDVMNQQRKTIYSLRRQILEGSDWLEDLKNKIEDIIIGIANQIDPKAEPEDYPWDALNEEANSTFKLNLEMSPETFAEEGVSKDAVSRYIYDAAEKELMRRIDAAGRIFQSALFEQIDGMLRSLPEGSTENYPWPAIAQFMRAAMNVISNVDASHFPTKESLAEFLYKVGARVAQDHFGKQVRSIHIEILDRQWKDHLLAMDHLREGIGLRGYGQKDPKQEYKKEGYSMFEAMIERITNESARYVFMLEFKQANLDQEKIADEKQKKLEKQVTEVHGDSIVAKDKRARAKMMTKKRTVEKVGRNDPCPCGSGKKFKKCHWGQAGFEDYM